MSSAVRQNSSALFLQLSDIIAYCSDASAVRHNRTVQIPWDVISAKLKPTKSQACLIHGYEAHEHTFQCLLKFHKTLKTGAGSTSAMSLLVRRPDLSCSRFSSRRIVSSISLSRCISSLLLSWSLMLRGHAVKTHYKKVGSLYLGKPTAAMRAALSPFL